MAESNFLNKLNELQKLPASKIPDSLDYIGEQPDGEKKYSFKKEDDNSIYKDNQLKDIARAYYYERDGVMFQNNNELVDYFIDDRTWKQANSYSIGKELIYATSDAVSVDQKRRLKYLTEYWNTLPNFWQDGGRGYVSGIVQNFTKGVVDPTNIIGPVVGGQIVKQVAKKGGNYLLTKAVAGGVAAESAADAAIGSSVDAIVQKTEQELGISNKFDVKRNFTVAGLSGGASIVPGLPTTYFIAKGRILSEGLEKKFDKIKQQVFDYADPVKKRTSQIYGYKGTIDDYVKQGKKVDKILKEISDNPTDPLTKKLNSFYKDKPEDRGVLKLSAKEVKLLQKKDKTLTREFLQDPGESAYATIRELAASSTRGESAIKYKVVLPVVADRAKDGKLTNSIMIKGGFEDAGVEPYFKIIQPVADKRLLGINNDYIQARRSQNLRARGLETSMKTVDINAAIKKFNSLTDEDREVTKLAFKKHNEFSRALLELQRRAGILSSKQMEDILIDDPVYAPFYPKNIKTLEKELQQKKIAKISKIDEKVPKAIEGKEIDIVSGVKGPAKLRITGGTGEIEPIHESMMKYTFHAYKAADTNLAKLKIYDEIDRLEVITKGQFKASEIYRPVTQVKEVDAITKTIIKKVKEEAGETGVKLGKQLDKALEGQDSLKVTAFADTVKHRDSIIDVVYKNGKLKLYEIKDPAYMDMFKHMGGITHKYLKNLIYGNWGYGLKGKQGRGGFFGKVAGLSRIFPNLITHSPPFIAFNGIRDTLAGSINSAFGFNAYGFAPGLSTAIGFFKTFKTPKDMYTSFVKTAKENTGFKAYYRGFKEALSLNQNYQRALNSGMGFAGRRDTERFLVKLTSRIKDSPAKNKKAYLDSINYLDEIGYFAGDLGKAYGQLVNRIEYASRLAEFNFAKKVGASDLVAGFGGREISTDFGMRGANAYLNAYNRVTMFFNAGLEGFYKGVVRRPSENPIKFAAGVTATLVAPEILFWSLTNETPEYEDLDDDIKLLNFVIPIYEDTKSDGSHLRPDGTRRIRTFLLIPKPYDFGVFPNIARGILEAIQEGAPEIAVQYAYHSFAKILPGLATPTLASPIYDLIRNRNYKNQEIQPYYRTVGQYRDQLIKTNTTFTAEQIADGMNSIYDEMFSIKIKGGESLVSPITIDYILNNYLVGLASYPLDIAEAAMQWDDESYGPRPTARPDESDLSRNIFSIVTRRLTAKVPTKYSKNLSKLYDLKREAEKTKTSLESASNDLVRLFRNKMKIDVEKLKSDELRSAITTSEMLSEGLVAIKLLRERRQIIKFQKFNSTTGGAYTADEKRVEIDKLQMKENKLAYNLMRDLKESADPYLFMSTFGNRTFKTYANKNIKAKGWQKIVAGYFK
jgi:hypothetical protein